VLKYNDILLIVLRCKIFAFSLGLLVVYSHLRIHILTSAIGAILDSATWSLVVGIQLLPYAQPTVEGMLRSVCLSVCLSLAPIVQQRCISWLWLLIGTPCCKSNPPVSVAVRPPGVAETAT